MNFGQDIPSAVNSAVKIKNILPQIGAKTGGQLEAPNVGLASQGVGMQYRIFINLIHFWISIGSMFIYIENE